MGSAAERHLRRERETPFADPIIQPTRARARLKSSIFPTNLARCVCTSVPRVRYCALLSGDNCGHIFSFAHCALYLFPSPSPRQIRVGSEIHAYIPPLIALSALSATCIRRYVYTHTHIAHARRQEIKFITARARARLPLRECYRL